jgi:hypothetical protein
MEADEEKGKDVAGSDWVGKGHESVLDLADTTQCLTGQQADRRRRRRII